MPANTSNNVRIESIVSMRSPEQLFSELPLEADHSLEILAARQRIAEIIHGKDKRLLVVVGPCSIHDPEAATEYASRLMNLRTAHQHQLEIVMRVYFEKPRTIVGWKGLINDPYRDGTFQIDEGLYKARKLLLDLAQLGMPAGCEFLDAATGQYYADTVSWGAIGARTTESQVHREIASGLSCPVGFKNATSGDVNIALDAIQAAGHPHAFLSPTHEGKIALFKTTGNDDAHLILRGGNRTNFDTASVQEACEQQNAQAIKRRILIDCSHANSNKDFRQQPIIASNIAQRLATEAHVIAGVMIESHLVEGQQNINDTSALTYGQSITDACIGWDDTEMVLAELAQAMEPVLA